MATLCSQSGHCSRSTSRLYDRSMKLTYVMKHRSKGQAGWRKPVAPALRGIEPLG
jgi:hypothetical protein